MCGLRVFACVLGVMRVVLCMCVCVGRNACCLVCVFGVMRVVLCMCVCVGRYACCLVSSHSTNKRRSLATAQSYTTSFHDSYHIVAIKPSTAAFTNNK